MVVSARVFRRTVAATAFAAALTVSPLLAAIAQALTLNGAGATFPAPLYVILESLEVQQVDSRSTTRQLVAALGFGKLWQEQSILALVMRQ
jgi:ABC-type phosphate transport system substrate-binding protein